MNKIFLTLTLILVTFGSYAAGDFNFHLNAGQDNPDDGETRTNGATLLKFELVNGKRIFRMGVGFTYLMGSGQFSQGELTVGPFIYPLGKMSKSPAQPFVFALGKVGFGTLSDKSRTDTGFGMGAGVDLHMLDRGGVTLAVEQHTATETATRLWFGIFWR